MLSPLLCIIAALLVQEPCINGNCPQTANIVTATSPHVRCIVSGSCGSGTIVGQTNQTAYVMTNAHVVGTRIGTTATVRITANGQTLETRGRIIASGYNNRTMVDYALLDCPQLRATRTMPMLRTAPTGQPFATTGSPRCVWPQVTKPFNDPRTSAQGIITGTPNAIGGQSGSAIYNAMGQQIALLTWSINGRCAGQTTQMVYRVATTRDANQAELRTGAEQETSEPDEPGKPHRRPLTENAIANQTNTDLPSLPIWVDPTRPPADIQPQQPQQPDPNCVTLTPRERAVIDLMRQADSEQQDRPPIDWVKLITLVIELLRLFNVPVDSET